QHFTANGDITGWALTQFAAQLISSRRDVIDSETSVGFNRQPEMMRVFLALLAFGGFPKFLLPRLWVFARRRFKRGPLRRKIKDPAAFPIEIGGGVGRHETSFDRPSVKAVPDFGRFAGRNFDRLRPLISVANHAADLQFTWRQMFENKPALVIGLGLKCC